MDTKLLLDGEVWAALASLTSMEIILGIDNTSLRQKEKDNH